MRPVTSSMLAVAAIGISVVVFAVGMMRQPQTVKGFKTRLPGFIFIAGGSLLTISTIADWVGIVHVAAIAIALIGLALIPLAIVSLVVVNLR